MHILKMRPIIRIIAAVTLVTFASSQLAFGYERKMGTVPRIGDSPHFSKLRAKAAGENNEVEAELANALGGEGRDDQPVAAAGIPLPAKEEAILAQPYPLAKSATPVGKMSLSRRLGAAIVLAGALFFSWISKLQADVPSSPRIIFKISVPIGSGSNAIDREKARYSLTKSQRLGLLAFIIGGGVILHNEKELRPALIFELLTSGAIPAIAASQNGQPTLDNALCGVSAGLVKLYAEKGMVDTGIGAPFKIIYCLGDSVVNNLIIGEKPLSRYDIDFGPLLFERMEGKTKVYLLPDSTYFLLANISKGNKFSVPLTLRYGTPIFIGNGEKTWELGGVTAAGTTRDNIVIIKPSWEDMKYVPNHETGHAWAYPSFRFLGYGIDRKIHEKWKWVPGWVRSDIDIGYTLFGLGSDRLTGFSPHDERLIELVPQSFTNYEFATARAAGIKNESGAFLSAARADGDSLKQDSERLEARIGNGPKDNRFHRFNLIFINLFLSLLTLISTGAKAQQNVAVPASNVLLGQMVTQHKSVDGLQENVTTHTQREKSKKRRKDLIVALFVSSAEAHLLGRLDRHLGSKGMPPNATPRIIIRTLFLIPGLSFHEYAHLNSLAAHFPENFARPNPFGIYGFYPWNAGVFLGTGFLTGKLSKGKTLLPISIAYVGPNQFKPSSTYREFEDLWTVARGSDQSKEISLAGPLASFVYGGMPFSNTEGLYHTKIGLDNLNPYSLPSLLGMRTDGKAAFKGGAVVPKIALGLGINYLTRTKEGAKKVQSLSPMLGSAAMARLMNMDEDDTGLGFTITPSTPSPQDKNVGSTFWLTWKGRFESGVEQKSAPVSITGKAGMSEVANAAGREPLAPRGFRGDTARASAVTAAIAQAERVQQARFDTAIEALVVAAQEQVRHSVETVLVVASSAGEAEVIAGALVEIGVDAKSIGTIIAQNLTPEQIAAYLRSAEDIVIIARRTKGRLLFVLGGIKIAVGTVTSSLAELKRRIVEACA